MLRKYLPKSLFWRSVLIVVAPMIILQVVLAYVIVQRHFDGVTRQMTAGVASGLRYAISVVDRAQTPEAAKAELERAQQTLGFPISLIERATLPPDPKPLFYDVIGLALESELRDRIDQPLFISLDADEKSVDIRAQTVHGVVLALLPRRRVAASNPHLLLTWMGATAAALIAISLIYLRNQIRPIQALATAAEAFGKGRSLPLRIIGAEEVRLAARAFLDMRGRIERQIEQRTRMLSGVSHDLRTPLTRMKLALEMMDDAPELEGLRHDVGEMEHISKEFLDYARGDQSEEFAPVDVSELGASVVEEARRNGATIGFFEQIDMPSGAMHTLRPMAIKRCLHNLISNALIYGERVSLSVIVSAANIEFIVEDDGPGIPEDRREDATRPFSRLDEARNQNVSAGVGLGLALVMDTARGHGGDLILDESPRLKGLRASVRLPR